MTILNIAPINTSINNVCLIQSKRCSLTNNILKEPSVKSLYIGTATFAVRKTQSVIDNYYALSFDIIL